MTAPQRPPQGADDLLRIRGLTLKSRASGRVIVDAVDLDVKHAEIVGIVGESGSGKSLTCKALPQLLPGAIEVAGGTASYLGRDLLTLSQDDISRYRGAEIGFIFQEPMTSLNPSMKIGAQLDEGLRLHTNLDARQRRAAILDMLGQVGIRDPEGAIRVYPHQFSGGMRQRIMIAGVMLLKPKLLIADEPTSALDAVVQADVLDTLVGLTRSEGTAVMLISHDMPMVARYADRIAVMERGTLVEVGDTASVLATPAHPYTRKLLASLPTRGAPQPPSDREPIVECRDVVVRYGAKTAVAGIDLAVGREEIVALVGASGSGKTTMGRVIAGLVAPSEGTLMFEGARVERRDRAAYRDYRLNCQMIFQDPFSSLDPRICVGDSVAEALRQVAGLSKRERYARTCEVLEEVGLTERHYRLLPHEMSGGQKQRVAIARAIVRRPTFVVADEPVSALDLTVKAQIIDLFVDLQKNYHFACLFISHDLGVVEQIADRVIVMENGQIVEQGAKDSVFDHPRHAYTRRLLQAIPVLKANDRGGVAMEWR